MGRILGYRVNGVIVAWGMEERVQAWELFRKVRVPESGEQ